MTIRHLVRAAVAAALPTLVACGHGAQTSVAANREGDSLMTRLQPQLPTGVRLDPEGVQHDLGQFPLTMIPSPSGRSFVLSLSGFDQQGLQVVDRATNEVTQTVALPSAFLGLAFSPDGRTLYASGGNSDVIYRLAWNDERATLRDSIIVAARAPRKPGTRYPAGLGLSPDGKYLYVAEDLADSVAVIEASSGTVIQRVATERYPYAVVVAPDGRVFASAWGGHTVSVFAPDADGKLRELTRVPAGRHPSSLLLNATGSRLFAVSGSEDAIAVIDTRTLRVVHTLHDMPPSGPNEGTTPNAVALSDDGTRLFVADADANDVSVIDLSASSSDVASAHGNDQIAGRIPTAWYPTIVSAIGDTLRVVSAKGRGTAANPEGPQPIMSREHKGLRGEQYTLAQLHATLGVTTAARASGAELAAFTRRVVHANRWDLPRTSARGAYPPFEHVVYVIKENRTYDQVLGDLPQADGDTSLVFFPRAVSPNHHALAERFGIFDRFFVNAEVSADGHNWSTAAYATDYLEKTVQSNYSDRRAYYDYEGTNRGFAPKDVPDDDVNEPANGYLWDVAARKGISLRNYGEFVVQDGARYEGTKPALRGHTQTDFPGFDLSIPDQRRADIWIETLHRDEQRGSMPALEIVRLPNDHTSGARAGAPTPRASFADNDLALGRMIEALSKSRFWRSTVVFVLEDDAQNGGDHVDSHRSPMLIVSAWNRGGVSHRFANTTDVLRTMEEILGLDALDQFDFYGRPLREIWSTSPDLRPYVAITPSVPLDERNPSRTSEARESQKLELDREDASDDALFNRILWRTIKGNVPEPAPRRMSALEARRAN